MAEQDALAARDTAPDPVSVAVLWLVTLTVTLAALLFLFAAFSLADRRALLARAQVITRNVAMLLDEHISRVNDAAALVAWHVAHQVRRDGFAAVAEEPESRTGLRESAAMLAPETTLWLIDGEGRIVLSTSPLPIEIAQLKGWEYLDELRQPDRIAAVGKAHLAWMPDAFVHARRLEAPDGSFAGIAVIMFRPGPFQDFFRSLPFGLNMDLLVVRQDGSALLHHPPDDASATARLARNVLADRLPARPADWFVAGRGADRRIVAYRTVSRWPLVVIASVRTEAVLAEWRRKVLRDGSLFGAVVVGLVALVVIGMRIARHEKLTRRQLEAANQRLGTQAGELREANRGLAAALSQMQEARSVAENAVHDKNRFLAAASHDLRQPLQALHLFLDVLDRRLAGSDVAPVVARALQALEGGENLLNALLDVSRLQAGTTVAQPVDFTVGELLDRLVEEVTPAAAAAGLALRRVICSAVVHTDPVLLQRMVRNLLINAIRYTRSGSILLGCRRRDETVRIEVWDTGPGIPADQQESVFFDFHRIERAGDTGGLGLGLGIVKRMGTLLGLEIGLRSQLGRGSVFWIVVPLAKKRRVGAEAGDQP